MKTKKKILLINPRLNVSKGSIRRLPTPLGLMYLGNVLEKGGHEVSILDSACEGYNNITIKDDIETYGLSDEEITKRIREENPDFVGVTCLFSKIEEEVKTACRIAKSVNPNISTVIGGIHPTLFAEKLMKENPEIDFIIQKEGESRLLDLVNNFQDYKSIDGLVFRKDEKVIINPPTRIEDINKLPLPARHLIDMEKYIDVGLFSNPFPKKERVAQVLASRGCIYHCDFCSTPKFWGKFRRRDAENILEEIIHLKDEYGIQEIQFRDDNLTIDRENALKLFRLMKPLKIVWCSGVMLQALNEKMVKAMAESGCYKLTISPESGSERILRELMHKPLQLEQVKPKVDLLHKYGISTHSDFIIGYPGETREEIYQTFEFAKEIQTNSASFFIAGPCPGSPLYERCKKKGWLDQGWRGDYKSSGIHIKKTDSEYVMSEKELIELTEKNTREFNELTKNNDPQAWIEKYKIFLEKHPEQTEKIMGRVV